MTVQEQIDLITLTFQTLLSPLLIAAPTLKDFNQYLAKPPSKSDDRELCTYHLGGKNTTDKEITAFMIVAQLYREKDLTPYFDLIKPFILKYITPKLLELENRVELDYGIYNRDENKTGALILFSLTFDVSLDDCEE